MAQIQIDHAAVRLVSGPVRSFDAGGAGDLGEPVYLAADGDVELADASDAAKAQAIGIVISAPGGKDSFVAGDRVDVALPGAVVTGFVGMTPADLVYASTTPGALDDTAPASASGDFKWIIGRALTATELLVMCWTDDAAAQ